MTWYEEQQEQQEEQLDWLHTIAEQLQEQNKHLAAIRRHTGLIYALAVIWIILTVLGIIGYLLGSR